MSADVRIAILIADASRGDDAEEICRALRRAAPYCRLHVLTAASENEFDESGAHGARLVAAALHSDVILYVSGAADRAGAALIALRERAGFVERLTEPDFARVWFSANRKRSLYVLGALPVALSVVALALEIGCGDPAAAERMRGASTAAA